MVYTYQIDIKMFYQSKNYPVLFQLSCPTQDNFMHCCNTIFIITHDSGSKLGFFSYINNTERERNQRVQFLKSLSLKNQDLSHLVENLKLSCFLIVSKLMVFH